MKGYVVSKGLDGTEIAYRPKKIHTTTHMRVLKIPNCLIETERVRTEGSLGPLGTCV